MRFLWNPPRLIMIAAVSCLLFSTVQVQAETGPAAKFSEQENLFWVSIKDSTNPKDFEAYLTQYPDGVFRGLAKNRLEDLRHNPSSLKNPAGERTKSVGSDLVTMVQGKWNGKLHWYIDTFMYCHFTDFSSIFVEKNQLHIHFENPKRPGLNIFA